MGPIAGALEMHHAVETSIRGAIALVAMGIEFLLGEDVPTVLFAAVRRLAFHFFGDYSVFIIVQGCSGPQVRACCHGGREQKCKHSGGHLPRRKTRPWWAFGELFARKSGEQLAGRQWIDERSR